MSFSRSGDSRKEWFDGAHKFEHWYRDNSIYLITARVRDKRHVFTASATQQIFWSKFDQYTTEYAFVPWVTTLICRTITTRSATSNALTSSAR